ncbi:alpha/beta fold hydrolase [Robiginitalea myxolifaciens]|nr:alpha/beta fold hydrolase [Robiginitalea myxolifaciens]
MAVLLQSAFLSGQELSMEPYEFISRAGDTVSAELGLFYVPENRNEQGMDSLQLAFVRFKSTNPNPGTPIVYLAGGPGGSGTGTARGRRFELFMKLRQVADVIAFDQRGTGMSQRLPDCPYRAEFQLEKAIEKSEYVEKAIRNAQSCMDYWEGEKVDLSAYNTTENAIDIDALRQALGSEKISIWGISYGSHLAFEYIRLFENTIDRMVLASLEGPNETIKLPENTEEFVKHIASLAADNFGSETKYPNLLDTINAVHNRLANQPATGTFINRQGNVDTVGISLFELQATIATFYLKNPSDSKNLPQLYSEMYAGDFSAIAANVMVIKRYVLNSIRPMPFAMDMQSGMSRERAQKINEQINNTLYGSTINFLLYEMMTGLDFPMLPEAFRRMENNDVQALLLSGTLDGRTYLTSGKALADKFTKGQHLVIENGGHDLFMQSPEIGNTILEFFKGNRIAQTRIVLDPVPFN